MKLILGATAAAAILAVASFAIAADSAAKADKDMQDVLNSHASLKPKPMENLTAVEARQQPSPGRRRLQCTAARRRPPR